MNRRFAWSSGGTLAAAVAAPGAGAVTPTAARFSDGDGSAGPSGAAATAL